MNNDNESNFNKNTSSVNNGNVTIPNLNNTNTDNENINNKENIDLKEKNSSKIIVPIIFTIVLVILIIIFVIFFTKKKENIIQNTDQLMYNFEYTIEQTKYIANVYNDKINFKINYFCSEEVCNDIQENTLDVKYSKNNFEKLVEFIKNTLKVNENKTINFNNLDSYSKNVLMTLHQNEYLFEIEYEKYNYKLEYINDDYSKVYHIYFKEDNIILIKVAFFKEEKIDSIINTNIEFSKENTNKLYTFAKTKTNNLTNNKFTKYGKFDKDDENIFKSLIYNDESFLKNEIIRFLYQIRYTNINCPSPVIKLYSDNSYEYFTTHTVDGSYPTPKIGIYDFNIKDIINNVNKSNCKTKDIEITTEENEIINTCLSNEQLNLFLNKYDFKLDFCITQE